jgi:hypothetical protein
MARSPGQTGKRKREHRRNNYRLVRLSGLHEVRDVKTMRRAAYSYRDVESAHSACINQFVRSGARRDTMSSGKLVNLAILGGVLVLTWVPVTGGSASAQSYDPLSRPVIGGTSGMQDLDTPPRYGSSEGKEILRHRDIAGNPCLTVGGFAQAHLEDPNLYDNVITVENQCPQRIAMQVCYYQSDSCIQMDIPGESRKEAILGILPASKDFRFEFREKF